jgi:hypothetical protein
MGTSLATHVDLLEAAALGAGCCVGALAALVLALALCDEQVPVAR